jgi:hypothetical protein
MNEPVDSGQLAGGSEEEKTRPEKETSRAVHI